MNVQKTKKALEEGLITQWEHDFIIATVTTLRRCRESRNNVIRRMALYDVIETAPGEYRPVTLEEIGAQFEMTRERVRQVINKGDSDPYPLILQRRANQRRLYREAMAAARKNRATTVFKRGPNKGKQRPEFAAYRAMLQRCFNPRNPSYPNYGGRGVTVIERWLGTCGYQHFIEDMGPRPTKKKPSGRAVYSIHRIDNATLYSPSTCRWATQRQQCANGQRRPRKSRKKDSPDPRNCRNTTGGIPDCHRRTYEQRT